MASKFPLINTILLILAGAGIYFYSRTNEMIDFIPLLIGNIALYLISMLSYSLISKSLKSENPNALMQAKMTGTMLKFFSVITLVLAYVFIFDRELKHKPNVYTFVGLYVVYMLIESVFLSNLARKKK